MKYYRIDIVNATRWNGKKKMLTNWDRDLFGLKEGDQIKLYADYSCANGIVTRDNRERLCILRTSKFEELSQEDMEKIDGGFTNGESYGREQEIQNTKRILRTLGYSDNEIYLLMQENRVY